MTTESEIDVLKHRPPFRFVGTVSPPEDDDHCISGSVSLSEKSVSLYDPFLGPVIILEALTQLSGILLGRVTGLRNGGVLAAIHDATIRPRRPSTAPIEMRAQLIDANFPLYTLRASGVQNEEEFCTCHFVARINE